MTDLLARQTQQNIVDLRRDHDELRSIKLKLHQLQLKYCQYLPKAKVQTALHPFFCSINHHNHESSLAKQSPLLPPLPKVRIGTTPLFVKHGSDHLFSLEVDHSLSNFFGDITYRLKQTVTSLLIPITRPLNIVSSPGLSVYRLNITEYGDYKEQAINEFYRLLQYELAKLPKEQQPDWQQVDQDFHQLHKYYQSERFRIQGLFLRQALQCYAGHHGVANKPLFNDFDIDYHHCYFEQTSTEASSISKLLHKRQLDYREHYQLFTQSRQQQYLSLLRDYLTKALCVTLPILLVIYGTGFISTILPIFVATLALVAIYQKGLGESLLRLLSSTYNKRLPSYSTINAISSFGITSIISSFMAHSSWAISTICYQSYYTLVSIYSSIISAPSSSVLPNKAVKLSTSDAPLHQLALSTELSHDVDNNDDGSSLHLLSLNKLAHTWRMKIHRTFSQCPMDDGMQSLMAKCYKWTQILDQTLNNRENTIFNVSSLAQQFNKVSTQLFQVHSALINNQQGQKYKAKADQIKLMELANVVIELYQATRHLTIVANDEASKAQQLNVSDHKLTLSEMFATTQHHYVTPNQDQIDGETNFHHLLLPEFSI